MSGFEYIRSYYGVPAKRGMQIRFEGNEYGRITGTNAAHLKAKMNDGRVVYFHPTYRLEYLTEKGWVTGKD